MAVPGKSITSFESPPLFLPLIWCLMALRVLSLMGANDHWTIGGWRDTLDSFNWQLRNDTFIRVVNETHCFREERDANGRL